MTNSICAIIRKETAWVTLVALWAAFGLSFLLENVTGIHGFPGFTALACALVAFREDPAGVPCLAVMAKALSMGIWAAAAARCL